MAGTGGGPRRQLKPGIVLFELREVGLLQLDRTAFGAGLKHEPLNLLNMEFEALELKGGSAFLPPVIVSPGDDWARGRSHAGQECSSRWRPPSYFCRNNSNWSEGLARPAAETCRPARVCAPDDADTGGNLFALRALKLLTADADRGSCFLWIRISASERVEGVHPAAAFRSQGAFLIWQTLRGVEISDDGRPSGGRRRFGFCVGRFLCGGPGCGIDRRRVRSRFGLFRRRIELQVCCRSCGRHWFGTLRTHLKPSTKRGLRSPLLSLRPDREKNRGPFRELFERAGRRPHLRPLPVKHSASARA